MGGPHVHPTTGHLRALARRARELHSATAAHLVTGTTLARIALGFVQCLSVQRRFLQVRWPVSFMRFLEALDHLTLEIFDLIPAECALNRPLGVHIGLIATLATPLVLLLVLLLLALILAPCAGRGFGPRALYDAEGG